MADKRRLLQDEDPKSHPDGNATRPSILPRQQRLYEALVAISPALAAMYLGALVVLGDTQNPDRFALSAHGIRELVDNMPRHLGVKVVYLGQKLSDKVGEINRGWTSIRPRLADCNSGSQLSIDEEIASFFCKLDQLLADSEAIAPGQDQELAEVLRLLDGSRSILPPALEKRNVSGLRALAGFFVRVLHHSTEPREDEFRNRLDLLESFLLDQLRPRTFEEHAALDALLALDQPTPSNIEEAIELISKRPINYAYFFDRLQSSSWICPLAQQGFFLTAPEPESRDGLINTPVWPESRFLARMAGRSREVDEHILQIVLKIKTENVTVHDDLAKAALSMPADLTARWLKAEGKWVARQRFINWLLPDAYGQLISYLAKNGQSKLALSFAKVLLAVIRECEGTGDENDYSVLPSAKPRSRLDDLYYERMLKDHIPDLVAETGKEALQMLCSQLVNSLRPSGRTDTEKRDYSYIWHPEVKNDERRGMADFRNRLVSAVRDASVQLLNADVLSMEDLVVLLESYEWTIFRRIALHCLRVFPGSPISIISQRLVKRAAFRDHDVRHEYCLLLRERFADLKPTDQARILSWIEAGPHYLEKHDEHYEEDANAWRRDWLSLLVSSLPSDWRGRYDGLVSELGPAENPARTERSTAFWVGPTSPTGNAELSAMDVPELVDYLCDWVPTGQPMDPSPEGLGRVLETLVASRPTQFADCAMQFCRIEEPTYISSLFRGLRQALKQGHTFRWRLVIQLADHTLQRPREIPGRSDEGRDADPHWGWARQAIAALLEEGFFAQKGRPRYQLRESIWKLLEVLAEDPDPTAEYEAAYGGTNMDPSTMSINTVRGVAMHATIAYALWVRRYLEKQPNAQERVAHGFGEMPEVRRVLDRHLDASRDASVTVRAVYGRWLPQLVLIDENWVESNVPRIFPEAREEAHLRDAAWEAYLLFGQLYGKAYCILAKEYSRAIDRVGRDREDKRHGHDPDQRMAEHLMTIYWWGRIGFEELGRFFATAPPVIRGHALSFIGQSLAKAPPDVTPGGLERLVALWEWRLATVKKELKRIPRKDLRDELSHFGWWFVSNAFERSWALNQLREALALAKWAEPDEQVVQDLADLAPRKPDIAVECLANLAEGDEYDWGLDHAWEENPRRILTTALRSKDARARQAAADLINRLGQRGFLQFGDLLSG